MVGGSPASSLLQPGDLLLAIDGKVVTEFREVEQAPSRSRRSAGDSVARQRRADDHRCPPWRCPGRSSGESSNGRARRCRRRSERCARSAAFVPWAFTWTTSHTARRRRATGSSRDAASSRSTVSRRPISTRSSRRLPGRPDRSSLRLKTITWNNAPEVITLKLDKHYWPAYELLRTPDGWARRSLELSRDCRENRNARHVGRGLAHRDRRACAC